MMRLIGLLISVFVLVGCPIEGDTGKAIHCWDLNEDYMKTFPDEDTNGDGIINVLDCRGGQSNIQSNIVIDATNGTFAHQHTRIARATYKPGTEQHITMSDISPSEYSSLLGASNLIGMDAYLTDPIDDPCNVWKWEALPEDNSVYALTATNGLATSVLHFPAIIIPHDPADEAGAGFQMCESSCLSNDSCIGAFYVRESNADNALRCVIIEQSPVVQSVEPRVMETNGRGFVAANMLIDYISSGLISVCE
ncbi:hypothetical protein H4F18_06385 [Vibrio scophthalmi]|uniref:hypothetical protein n=1 Tax=Vibrio scophthalmi TaxID=45658 RepID=UPI002FEE8DF4